MKNNIIKIFFVISVFLFCGCGISDEVIKEEDTEFIENGSGTTEIDNVVSESESQEDRLNEEVENLIENMTLEEKVAQLFVVLPESLIDGVECVTAAGKTTEKAINEIPVGGFVYLRENLCSEEQVESMLLNVQKYSLERIGVPAFLCVDEEGGTVTRLSGTGRFDISDIEDMAEIGQKEDFKRAKEVGIIMGDYLSDLGFNVDFAPVADVLTNSENKVVRKRSFGSEAELVSQMSVLVMEGLEEKGVYATYKHFPGHGDTTGDTHEGYAYSEKSLEELEKCELVPFRNGIEKGVSFIMVGHISFPNIIGDETPASLSKYIVNDLLREQMGYDGIIITDAMNMGAIAENYSSKMAAIKAIEAGVDIILMPENFKDAYKGIIEAVKDGTISEERIDESLKRILFVKVKMENKDWR